MRSAASDWPLVSGWVGAEARLAASARRAGPVWACIYEFVRFGAKQGWACLFGGLLLGLILASRLWYPPRAVVPRYDALVFAALAIQAALLIFGLETLREAKIILVFHAVGTLMELFKTSIGSWTYPEPSLLRIGHVPLFSGFMYAAVGSYLFRVWRLFHFSFDSHPRPVYLIGLSILIYANFFADHWGVDLRWFLIAIAGVLFWPTTVHFRVWEADRHMPLLMGFALVTLFIWFGENLGTAGHAWIYPSQLQVWTLVSPTKLTSWFLLMLVSYTLVATVMLGVRPQPPSDSSSAAASRCSSP